MSNGERQVDHSQTGTPTGMSRRTVLGGAAALGGIAALQSVLPAVASAQSTACTSAAASGT